jgi:hypothetical protein
MFWGGLAMFAVGTLGALACGAALAMHDPWGVVALLLTAGCVGAINGWRKA